ncbi:MAG: TlyA family RNA methyltransferase [Clostridiales bacterium]|nr:TlyA family RNA methyltransferase [Clostridiales bacterium]
MPEKVRADVALVNRGLAESREKAQAAIMAGSVYIGEKKILKASEPVRPEDELLIRAPQLQYVSRGALKLEKAVRVFNADLRNRTVMDIGSSTGGFTEVCLLSGASRVYSIDVGYGQLDWKLRNDPRVTVMERTNARYLTEDMFPVRPEVTVMDVSFISIRLILPAADRIMGPDGVFYSLIKPQFEAGRENVGKKGVVRDPEIHRMVIDRMLEFTDSAGLCLLRLDYSPITGPEGNIEFISEIRRKAPGLEPVSPERVSEVISEAHRVLSAGR